MGYIIRRRSMYFTFLPSAQCTYILNYYRFSLLLRALLLLLLYCVHVRGKVATIATTNSEKKKKKKRQGIATASLPNLRARLLRVGYTTRDPWLHSINSVHCAVPPSFLPSFPPFSFCLTHTNVRACVCVCVCTVAKAAS